MKRTKGEEDTRALSNERTIVIINDTTILFSLKHIYMNANNRTNDRGSGANILQLFHKVRDATVLLAFGENLIASVGHQKGLLKLSRSFAIGSDCRPFVRPRDVAPRALRDHRLDRERVPGLHDAHGLVLSIVRHLWGSVKQSVDAVATIAAHHREAVLVDMLLNDIAQLAITLAGHDQLLRLLQRIVGGLHQLQVLWLDLAN